MRTKSACNNFYVNGWRWFGDWKAKMTGDDAVLAVIEALEGLGVGYMLVGSLSSNFYGSPCATQDADFIIQFGDAALDELRQRLGPAFQFDRPCGCVASAVGIQAPLESRSARVHSFTSTT